MEYFETSAKTDVGVTDLMKHTFKQTYDFKQDKRAKAVPEVKQSFPLDRVRHSEVATKQQKE